MDRRIHTASARLDDDSAMAIFLAPIPNSEQLAAVLANNEPVSTRAYDDETGTARFVESDGHVAKCFTVTDITIDQAEMIETECEATSAWDDKAFEDAVARALGD
jgi:GH24 family phage-related lysozyme (muramidase)